MDNLGKYPHVPHPGRTDTSALAAELIARQHQAMKSGLYQAIEAAPDGLTSDAAAVVAAVNPYTARARTAELREDGLIKDSGVRRPNMNGRPAIVWTPATASERQALIDLKIERVKRSIASQTAKLRRLLAEKAANDDTLGSVDSHAMSQPVTRDRDA